MKPTPASAKASSKPDGSFHACAVPKPVLARALCKSPQWRFGAAAELRRIDSEKKATATAALSTALSGAGAVTLGAVWDDVERAHASLLSGAAFSVLSGAEKRAVFEEEKQALLLSEA